MPSAKGYKRNYKQENKTAKRRKETAAGPKSGDATRHRARRKAAKTQKVAGKDVHHKKPLKSGGSNSKSNLRTVSRSKNRSAGGKIGSRKGKAAGARKAHRSR